MVHSDRTPIGFRPRVSRSRDEGRREADLVALMGRMAVHTGQMVAWDQAMQSNFEYVKDIDHMTFDTPAPVKAGPDGIYPAPLPGMCKEI